MANYWQINTTQIDKTNAEGNFDSTGYGQISILLSKYVLKEKGKGLSSNDFKDVYIQKLDSIEQGSQKNKLETLSINNGGVLYPTEEKNININIPTKVSELINDLAYAKTIDASEFVDYSDSYVGKSKTSFEEEENIGIGKNAVAMNGGVAIGKNTSTSEVYDVNILNKLKHNNIYDVWEGRITESIQSNIALKNSNNTDLTQLDSVIENLQTETTNRINGYNSLNDSINSVSTRTTSIENKIPSQATSENQLADKSYVSDSILTESNDRINADNALSSSIDGIGDRVSTIENKIPSQATSENQLADKAFVASSIQTNTANFRGNWNTWTDVPTDSESYPTDYSGSSVPTNNDYMVVSNLSDYTETSLVGTWRFKYIGIWENVGKNGWIPEYQVNEEPFTSEQNYAINSGITSSKVSSYDSHLLNMSNPHSVTASQVGLGNVTNVSTESTITENSDKNITSGAVYNALQLKMNSSVTHLSGDVPTSRKINGYDLTEDRNLTSSDVGALDSSTVHLSGDVPISRKINGISLSSDITLTASDVGALDSSVTHLSGDVPTSRTINGYDLSENRNLTASDVGALADDQVNTVSQNGYVVAPTLANANKVWKTDENGNPNWREESSANSVLLDTDQTIDGNKTFINPINGLINRSSSLDNAIQLSSSASSPSKEIDLDGFVLFKGARLIIEVTIANTHQGTITLSVNSTTPTPIKLNGALTSSTNYNLSLGYYDAYYNGTNWCLDSECDSHKARHCGNVQNHTLFL